MFRLSSLAQQQHLHNNNIITAVASNKSEGLVQLSEMETFLTLFGAAAANHYDRLRLRNGNNEQTCRIDGEHHITCGPY